MTRMDDLFDSGLSSVILLLLLVGLVVLVALIFFLVTLQKTLENVAPDNRKMVPGLVWLYLIPYFNIIWTFVIAGKMADSLAAEFKRRNITVFEERPGFGTGTALGCVAIFNLLLGLSGSGILSLIMNVVFLACWVTYWVKIAGFRSKLAETGHWSQYAPVPQYAPPAGYMPPPNPFMPPPPNPFVQPAPNYPPPPPANPFMQPPPPQYPPVYPPQYPPPPADPNFYPPPFPPAPPQDPNDLSRWAPPADPNDKP